MHPRNVRTGVLIAFIFIQAILIMSKEVFALAPNSEQVKKILSAMSWKDKLNQMSQIHIGELMRDGQPDQEKIELLVGKEGVGSILVVPLDENKYVNASFYRSLVIEVQAVAKTYGRPPVIFGIDSVHGANYIQNATMIPHQINMAATFNISNAEEAGRIASRDTRAAGINWIFSPIVGIGIQPYWSRMYETFGEDPFLVGEMAKAMIEGIQEIQLGSIPSRTAACAKHFIGYSFPKTGHDRSPSWIPVRHLYQYFVPPWRKVIDDGVLTVMESYTEYDGVPNVSNRNSLQVLLRQELGFSGLLITDYAEIRNLFTFHKVAKDDDEAVSLAIERGSVDMTMIPVENWFRGILKLIKSAKKDQTVLVKDRIDQSVGRILRLKEELGMFDEKIHEFDVNLELIGNDIDRKTALQIARDSITLVKNDSNKNDGNVLPITTKNGSKQKTKVHITGPTSNKYKYQSGGWSILWQGADADSQFSYGTSVLEAAQNVESWDVSSSCGVDIMGNTCMKDETYDSLQSTDYIIVCIGEENYTEKPGDIRDLRLASGQIDFVSELRRRSEAKVIVVYFGGRPRILGDIVKEAEGIFIAFLPGPDAGQAVIDLIVGTEHMPHAKLPITYPKYQDGGGVPYWHAVSDQCTASNPGEPLPHWAYTPCEVEWMFGHGLTYTQFHYSSPKVHSTEIEFSIPYERGVNKDNVRVSVTIKNVGSRAGYETVLLFLVDESRHVTPEKMRLFHFEKVWLAPDEEKEVSTEISVEHLRHIGADDEKHLVLQPGMRFRVRAGAGMTNEDDGPMFSDYITLKNHGQQYDAVCEAACDAWNNSRCGNFFNIHLKTCWDLCTESKRDIELNRSWGWNYVTCIESVVSHIKAEEHCPRMTSLCRNIFSDTKGVETVASVHVEGPNMMVAVLSGVLGCLIILAPFLRKEQTHHDNTQRSKAVFLPVSQR